MRNQEEDRRRIQQALQHLSPDEAAKDRMYAQILKHAADAERKEARRPWYRRWQTASAGICTVALACAVVMMAAVHNRMPQNGTDQLVVLQPTTETAVVTALPEQPPETQTQPLITTTSANTAEKPQESRASQPAKRQTAETACAAVTDAAEDAVQTEPVTTAVQTETAQTTVKKTTAAETQTKPVRTTTAVTKATTAQTQPTEPAQTTVTTKSSQSNISIRQNIYLYHILVWQGISYDTQYTEISSRELDEYLGNGITNGEDVDDTYVVLIYSVKGADGAQQLAIQYAGTNQYYLFTAV